MFFITKTERSVIINIVSTCACTDLYTAFFSKPLLLSQISKAPKQKKTTPRGPKLRGSKHTEL